MQLIAHHQNFMLSLRQEMGWPTFRPANNCIGWTTGKPMDFDAGMELGRVAAGLGKDLIHSSWKSVTAKQVDGISIGFREMLSIDIIDGLVPYAASDDAPVVLVNVRGNETFSIDTRGSLTRLPGKPQNLRAGRKLAMRRIKAGAEARHDELLENNRYVPRGGAIAPDAAATTIVQFR